jgi:DNA-binding winged helix-turn-helix (wHTH) protein/predicted ATPase
MHYIFGDYSLDTARYELRRAGAVVPLRSKVFDVLAYLVTHHDRVVSRDEILNQVWPAQFIADSTLTSCVKAVRQAVGDTGHAQRLIKTVYGRGYRCLAPVTRLETASPEATLAALPPPQEAALSPLPVLPLQTSVSPASVRRFADAERRPLTVLVCDLAQAAHLVEQLDPEDLRQVMRAYHTTCEAVLEQFDGYLAQRLESRLLVYFGYPRAQEDAAQRAVLTALGLLEALSAFDPGIEQMQEVALSLRVGIDSGLVVVEAVGGERPNPPAIGSTQSRAVQLHEVAAPQSVVISADTLHLVQGWFCCHELSSHVFQGADTPVPVYQVTGRSGVQHRLEVVTHGALTPLVGREQEVGLLSERWQQVCEGQGQVVVLSGEAGIGKSRLVQVLKEDVISEPHLQWECRSSPYYQNTALYPITELLQRVLDWQSDEASVVRLEKLEALLARSRLAVSDTVPLLAPLLSVSLPETRYPPLGLSPQRQRQKTLESIVALLLAQTEHQPVLFMLEDLHWMDPTTLELLDLLLDQVPTASLLTLLTCRPEYQPPWRHRSYLTQVTLHRLSRSQSASMATRVAGKTLPDEVLQQIVAKTDGIPLFVEEMTKAVLESGTLKNVDGQYELTTPVTPLTIPATLHDSLMARLDRLGTAKGVAQYAAVLGRQCSYALLHAVSQVEAGMLQNELRRLVQAELLYQRGPLPQATYTFKHALIRDAAYQSLLRSTCQHYHQRTAQVLEEQFPETAETQPEVLAYHYTQARRYEKAVDYWLRAGRLAMERSANREAISHLTAGVEVLKSLPDTPERHQYELVLQTTLGPALMAVKGYAAPDVEQVYTRARALCELVGATRRLLSVLGGLGVVYLMRGEYQTACEIGEQHRLLAERHQDVVRLLRAHFTQGEALFHLGQFVAARTHLEQGLALYGPQQDHAHALRTEDLRVGCLSYLAWTLWWLGYPAQALRKMHEALHLADELSHPQSRAWAHDCTAILHQVRREAPAAREQSEAAIKLAGAHGFAQWMAAGMVLHGWVRAVQKREDEGIAELQQGITAWRNTVAELSLSHWLALLSEGYGSVGQTEMGLTTIGEALAVVAKRGEGYYEGEINRLQGELLLKQTPANPSAAETCFQKALSVARAQQAKSWELRAAISLARLWQSQDKRQEASDLLVPVYAWFTEGFDTADLIDAKSLLDELSVARMSPTAL